jgi:hypothetical protein
MVSSRTKLSLDTGDLIFLFGPEIQLMRLNSGKQRSITMNIFSLFLLLNSFVLTFIYLSVSRSLSSFMTPRNLAEP